MNITEAMDTLKQLGTEQNRKIYKRHGVNGSAFGVSYSELGKLRKKIKSDHGETGCKTPDAAQYIKKAAARVRSGG
jgi:hypothetical protein